MILFLITLLPILFFILHLDAKRIRKSYDKLLEDYEEFKRSED